MKKLFGRSKSQSSLEKNSADVPDKHNKKLSKSKSSRSASSAEPGLLVKSNSAPPPQDPAQVTDLSAEKKKKKKSRDKHDDEGTAAASLSPASSSGSGSTALSNGVSSSTHHDNAAAEQVTLLDEKHRLQELERQESVENIAVVAQQQQAPVAAGTPAAAAAANGDEKSHGAETKRKSSSRKLEKQRSSRSKASLDSENGQQKPEHQAQDDDDDDESERRKRREERHRRRAERSKSSLEPSRSAGDAGVGASSTTAIGRSHSERAVMPSSSSSTSSRPDADTGASEQLSKPRISKSKSSSDATGSSSRKDLSPSASAGQPNSGSGRSLVSTESAASAVSAKSLTSTSSVGSLDSEPTATGIDQAASPNSQERKAKKDKKDKKEKKEKAVKKERSERRLSKANSSRSARRISPALDGPTVASATADRPASVARSSEEPAAAAGAAEVGDAEAPRRPLQKMRSARSPLAADADSPTSPLSPEESTTAATGADDELPRRSLQKMRSMRSPTSSGTQPASTPLVENAATVAADEPPNAGASASSTAAATADEAEPLPRSLQKMRSTRSATAQPVDGSTKAEHSSSPAGESTAAAEPSTVGDEPPRRTLQKMRSARSPTSSTHLDPSAAGTAAALSPDGPTSAAIVEPPSPADLAKSRASVPVPRSSDAAAAADALAAELTDVRSGIAAAAAGASSAQQQQQSTTPAPSSALSSVLSASVADAPALVAAAAEQPHHRQSPVPAEAAEPPSADSEPEGGVEPSSSRAKARKKPGAPISKFAAVAAQKQQLQQQQESAAAAEAAAAALASPPRRGSDAFSSPVRPGSPSIIADGEEGRASPGRRGSGSRPPSAALRLVMPAGGIVLRSSAEKAGSPREMHAAKRVETFHYNVGQRLGNEVWKIAADSNEMFHVPDAAHGAFNKQDCYIVLNNALASVEEDITHRLYLWVGKDSPALAEAMARVAELEQKLQNRAQHQTVREGEESEEFKSLFATGIRHIEPIKLSKQVGSRNEERPRRLYRIGGAKVFLVKQMPLAASSLNHGDLFILDDESKIYQWMGRNANRLKAGKALDLTTRMRDERMTRVKATVEIFGAGDEPPAAFWEALGGSIDDVAPALTPDQSLQWEREVQAERRLYRCSEDGTIEAVEPAASEAGGDWLHAGLLETDKCFVLDCGTELFAWLGKASSPRCKQTALTYADDLLKQDGRPTWVHVSKQTETCEEAVFRSKFRGTFREYVDTPEEFKKRLSMTVPGKGVAGPLQQMRVNVDRMHHPEKYANVSEDLPPPVSGRDPSGVVSTHLFVVRQHEKHELEAAEYGTFCAANCYLFVYSLSLPGSQARHVVYFWQGRKASVDDKGSAALLARDHAHKLGRDSTQVRVQQGKEPEHFMSHFIANFVIRNGSRDKLLSSDASKQPRQAPLVLQVRGGGPLTTRTVEVSPLSLTSADAVIVVPPAPAATVFVWCGRGANESQKGVGQAMARRLAPEAAADVLLIAEGSEPDEFWTALGGRRPYVNAVHFQRGDVRPRFFHCSEGSGVFGVREVVEFTQDDLVDTDAVILDGRHEAFLWLGSKANRNKLEQSRATVVDYVQSADDGRSQCPIYVVAAGHEPLEFAAYFAGWQFDDKRPPRPLAELETIVVEITGNPLAKIEAQPATRPARSTSNPPQPALMVSTSQRVYQPADLKPPVDFSKPAAPTASDTHAATESTDAPITVTLPYHRLVERPLPPNIVLSRLEDYLPAEDFESVFNMSREQFAKLPKWKVLNLKKEKKLF